MKIEDIEEIDLSPENKSNDGNTSPTMVFSVIGDSDSFVPRPWPTTVFQTALIEAAKSGGGKKWYMYTNIKLFKDYYLSNLWNKNNEVAKMKKCFIYIQNKYRTNIGQRKGSFIYL